MLLNRYITNVFGSNLIWDNWFVSKWLNFQRNEELELKFADITKVNLDLQKTERELRDQIVTSIPKEHVDELEKRVKVS